MASPPPAPWRALATVGLAVVAGVIAPPCWVAAAHPLALLLVVAAIPHGALDDHLLGQALGVSDRKGRGLCWATYLGAVVLMLGLAWLVPSFIFAVFLVISAYHFGQSELPPSSSVVECLARGGTYVLLLYSHAPPVKLPTWFVVLEPSHASVAAAGCVIFHLWAWRRRVSDPTETAAAWSSLLRFFSVASLLVLVDPLVGFAVYFCLWHATDHVLLVDRDHRRSYTRRALLAKAAPNALASVGAVVAIS
ncbi:MAG: Brp/Blh family beta-carotene 15,15'-dioxygenase, partial [Myxococcota bacterium]